MTKGGHTPWRRIADIQDIVQELDTGRDRRNKGSALPNSLTKRQDVTISKGGLHLRLQHLRYFLALLPHMCPMAGFEINNIHLGHSSSGAARCDRNSCAYVATGGQHKFGVLCADYWACKYRILIVVLFPHGPII
jgi:hypothetical protein